jgi:hypothetical protein
VFFGAVIVLLLLVCFLISTKGTASIRKDTSTATEDVGASRSNTEEPFMIVSQRKGEVISHSSTSLKQQVSLTRRTSLDVVAMD